MKDLSNWDSSTKYSATCTVADSFKILVAPMPVSWRVIIVMLPVSIVFTTVSADLFPFYIVGSAFESWMIPFHSSDKISSISSWMEVLPSSTSLASVSATKNKVVTDVFKLLRIQLGAPKFWAPVFKRGKVAWCLLQLSGADHEQIGKLQWLCLARFSYPEGVPQRAQ